MIAAVMIALCVLRFPERRNLLRRFLARGYLKDTTCNQEQKFDYIVNIQGDEPFTNAAQMQPLIDCLDGDTEIATLGKFINSAEVLWDETEVKIVLDKDSNAMYFSRSVIPAQVADIPKENWHKEYQYIKHSGVYAYRADVLETVAGLAMTRVEELESLEQLRWLEHGLKVKVAMTEIETMSIDTEEDLAAAKKLL